MSVTVENGKLRVSAGYSLKKPHDVQYASEEAHMGLSLEFDVEGEASAALAQGESLEAALAQQVKLMVFAQLGVEAEDRGGVLHPKLVEPARNQAKAAPSAPVPSSYNTQQTGGGGGGGQQNYVPKVSRETIQAQPVVTIDAHAYYDLRGLKRSGDFSPRAADFRSVSEGTKKQEWLTSKEGQVKSKVAEALVAGGFDARPFDQQDPDTAPF